MLPWSGAMKDVFAPNVSDQELTDAPPQHVLMAWAVMMPMDDNQLVGNMWDNFERMMDKDIHR
jgi:hypothetical protein